MGVTGPWKVEKEGRLKPRTEVRRLIADWIGQSQGGLPGDEAVRRAELLMQAMPASNWN